MKYKRNTKIKNVKVLRPLKSETLTDEVDVYLVATSLGIFKLNEFELEYYKDGSRSLKETIAPHMRYYQVVGNIPAGAYWINEINPDSNPNYITDMHIAVMYESFNYNEAQEELEKIKADAEASAF